MAACLRDWRTIAQHIIDAKQDNAPQNMVILRHITLNLLKQEQLVKVGLAAKRKMAGRDNDYLLCVLHLSVKS